MSIRPAAPAENPYDGPQKFPKPNTIPSGWDLSSLTAAPSASETVDEPTSNPDPGVSAELTEKYNL